MDEQELRANATAGQGGNARHPDAADEVNPSLADTPQDRQGDDEVMQRSDESFPASDPPSGFSGETMVEPSE